MQILPRTPRQLARSAARRTLRPSKPVLHGLLLVLTCGSIFLGLTGPVIERALALSTDQQVLGHNVFATTTLSAPDDFSGSPQGHDVALSWSEAQSGTGYAVFGVENGSSNDCSAAAFASLASTGELNYLDVDRYSPQGTWFCYQVHTTHDTWTSQQNNPVTAAQLVFVAASLQLINGGDTSACGEEQYGDVDDVDCGDQISVAFNQPVDANTGPGNDSTVCADQDSGTIWLGSTGSGACTSAEAVHLGRLSGGAIENGNSRFAASYDWNEAHTGLIVTIGALIYGNTYPTLSPSMWTLTPTENTGNLLSGSGRYHLCDTNADGGNCLPSASWTSRSSSRQARVINAPTATPTPDVPIAITETLGPTETLSPTDDPTATETPPIDSFTPMPSPTPTATPTDGPPTVTLEPTVELPMATMEPTLESLSTATP